MAGQFGVLRLNPIHDNVLQSKTQRAHDEFASSRKYDCFALKNGILQAILTLNPLHSTLTLILHWKDLKDVEGVTLRNLKRNDLISNPCVHTRQPQQILHPSYTL